MFQTERMTDFMGKRAFQDMGGLEQVTRRSECIEYAGENFICINGADRVACGSKGSIQERFSKGFTRIIRITHGDIIIVDIAICCDATIADGT